jgi:hypothetical protein
MRKGPHLGRRPMGTGRSITTGIILRRGLYFYYERGAWQVSVSLPTHIHITVGDYVTLEMDTDRPYTYHSDVVRRYPPGQAKKKDKGKKKR